MDIDQPSFRFFLLVCGSQWQAMEETGMGQWAREVRIRPKCYRSKSESDRF